MSLARRAEFFLARYTKRAEEAAEFDHESAAVQKLPYSDRKELINQAQEAQDEAEALRWLLDKVRAMPDAEL